MGHMKNEPAGKGRPTPKRKVSEAKRITSSLAPVVTKEQKREAKLATRQDRVASRGPARRFVRNYVDARRSIGEYFLPIIFVVLILTLIPTPSVQFGAIAIMYGVLIMAVVDGIFLGRRIRKLMGEKFPNVPTKGLGMYAWLRSTQMRRLRAPHPQTKVGDEVN